MLHINSIKKTGNKAEKEISDIGHFENVSMFTARP